MPSSPAQENAYLDDGDDTNLDGIDDAVAVAAKSAGEQHAGMMRIRGGMGAGASALTVESPDAEIKAAFEGASAQERSLFLDQVGEPEKRKLVSIGLDVPEAAPSGLTPGGADSGTFEERRASEARDAYIAQRRDQLEAALGASINALADARPEWPLIYQGRWLQEQAAKEGETPPVGEVEAQSGVPEALRPLQRRAADALGPFKPLAAMEGDDDHAVKLPETPTIKAACGLLHDLEVGEQEKMSLGLDVPKAAQSGLTPDASALSESQMLGQLSVPPTLNLKPHDFRELWREKKSAHLQGTREWAFAEILKWLDDPASPQLFWLMGGGGTGKSVLTAGLLDRVINRTVA